VIVDIIGWALAGLTKVEGFFLVPESWIPFSYHDARRLCEREIFVFGWILYILQRIVEGACMKAAFTMWKNSRMIILVAVCAAIYGAALIAFKPHPLIPDH
jgi:hypothetical protein